MTINFEDFQKIELRIAKILGAEKIENSEKLIKIQLDLGYEKRQIVAGIGKVYAPENLIGKEIVIVANLEPRKLMGVESAGMLLAAHGETGELALLAPDKETPPGSKVS